MFLSLVESGSQRAATTQQTALKNRMVHRGRDRLQGEYPRQWACIGVQPGNGWWGPVYMGMVPHK